MNKIKRCRELQKNADNVDPSEEYSYLAPQLADSLELALEALEVIATDKNCFEDAPEPEDWPHNVAQATLDKIRGKV